jgi:hypothetical protein
LNSAQANPDGLGKAIRNLALKGQITGSEYQRLIEDGLEAAVIAATADRDLSDEEILRIDEINSALGLKISDINDRTRELLAQALTIRDLRKGVVQSRVGDSSGLPIMLKQGEVVLWSFLDVRRFEPKTNTSYVGGSHGFSFRIMKGVSYRVGSHRGERIQTTSLVDQGTGALSVTNQATYFLTPGNTHRMAIKSMSTVECHADGLSLTPNRGKRQIFLMHNQQFATDLIKAVGALL